jgi:hypothetical protein
MVPADETVIEIDDNGHGLLAFIAWVKARDQIRVLFGPDVIMAIDTLEQRGWVADEIYFATAWIDRGVDEFIEELGDSGYQRQPSEGKQSPEEWLGLILKKGSLIDEVRHLI